MKYELHVNRCVTETAIVEIDASSKEEAKSKFYDIYYDEDAFDDAFRLKDEDIAIDYVVDKEG